MTHFPISMYLSVKYYRKKEGNLCVCVCVCISEFKAVFDMILIRLLVKYKVELLTWMGIK